jgi:diguanylate cyclase (GGDEF)-like protein
MGLISALMPFVLGLIMTMYWRDRKTYGGFACWILADFAFGVGYLMISLRGIVPDLFSIILGNVIAVYAEILIYEGVQRFYDRPVFSRLNYLILAGYVFLQTYFTYFDPNINTRTALVSVAFAILIIRSGISLVNCPLPSLQHTSQSTGLIFFLTAMLPIARMIYTLRQTHPIDLFTDPLSAWFSLIGLISILLWTFFFFLLNSARLELDLETARAELEEIASTDHLTGLYNRRHFFEHAELEFQRAKRQECNISFLLVDADDFKLINDNYGHDAGDAVMTTLSTIFRQQVRAFDLVARFGGDEFVIMLVDAGEDQAYAIAERIRTVAEETPIPFGARNLNIHLSVGISSFASKDRNLSVILKRADNALYHAKKQGRNRVRVA